MQGRVEKYLRLLIKAKVNFLAGEGMMANLHYPFLPENF
jgi:hypothetical protein